MSNTLEETKESLRQRFVNVILENNGTVNIPMVDALNGLILSEAHRIGMKVLGDLEKNPLEGKNADQRRRGRNELRMLARQRLSKITGVE